MKTYIIKKVQAPVTEESFKFAEVASINHIQWPDFGAPYQVSARILHTDDALYVNMETDEWPLTALHTGLDGDVCEDSCMEFFFAPDADDNRYFNFEVNPLGALCLGIGKDRYDRLAPVVDEGMFEIKSIIQKGKWQLFYKIPYSFIKEYFAKIDNEMMGNMYKCGDNTQKEHYITWSPVGTEEPDYHQSGFFGKFILEQ